MRYHKELISFLMQLIRRRHELYRISNPERGKDQLATYHPRFSTAKIPLSWKFSVRHDFLFSLTSDREMFYQSEIRLDDPTWLTTLASSCGPVHSSVSYRSTHLKKVPCHIVLHEIRNSVDVRLRHNQCSAPLHEAEIADHSTHEPTINVDRNITCRTTTQKQAGPISTATSLPGSPTKNMRLLLSTISYFARFPS